MIKNKLERFIKKQRCTLLGVGPMSKNCVDACIELSNDYDIPLMMIASRRQIDGEAFGGGYVNNWTTEKFAEYVLDKDKKGKVILARDHGGPWQNDIEKKEKMGLRNAMKSAKKSYQVDIESGFEVIHIDPSIDPFGTPSLDEILERIYELYEFCWNVAQNNKRDIIFEIGTEEQSGTTNTIDELEYVIEKMMSFCDQNKLPIPSFVVVQIGTRVLETRNVGTFDSPLRIANELPAEIQVPKVIEICNQYNIFMKEHNTDYLSDEALRWHPKLGIHSANVAPEFGVAETRALIGILKKYDLHDVLDKFIQLAYDSKKWEKWLFTDSNTDKFEKAVTAGHYVFGHPAFKSLKEEARSSLKEKSIDLDEFLKERVKDAIMRYLICFRMV